MTNITDQFSVRAGTVRGTTHIRKGINNHDSFYTGYISHSDAIVGIVCDGCGSGAHSEVGAKIGSSLVATSIGRHLMWTDQTKIWAGVRKEVTSHIHSIALAMENGVAAQNVIADHFLFTIVGFLITEEITQVFSIGDGFYATRAGDRVTPVEIGPFDGNSPPYISYNLVPTRRHYSTEDLEFTVETWSSETLTGVMVATDGVTQMNEIQDEVVSIGATGELVGPSTQFLDDPGTFLKLNASVQRKLYRVNPCIPQMSVNWDAKMPSLKMGLLSDDTTVVMATRSGS